MKLTYIKGLKANIGKPLPLPEAGFANWLGGRISEVTDEGELAFEFDIRKDMLNPFGILHGGVIAGMVDEMMGLQLFLHCEEEEKYVAIGLNVDFLDKVKVGDKVMVRPNIERKGRTTANATCRVESEAGKLIALASCNFARLRSND